MLPDILTWIENHKIDSNLDDQQQKRIILYPIVLVLVVLIVIPIEKTFAEPSQTKVNKQLICDRGTSQALKPNQVVLYVKGMVCGMCVQGITKLLKEVRGIQAVSIDLSSGSVTVDLIEGISTTDEVLKKAVDNAGYEVQKVCWPNQK